LISWGFSSVEKYIKAQTAKLFLYKKFFITIQGGMSCMNTLPSRLCDASRQADSFKPHDCSCRKSAELWMKLSNNISKANEIFPAVHSTAKYLLASRVSLSLSLHFMLCSHVLLFGFSQIQFHFALSFFHHWDTSREVQRISPTVSHSQKP
jgi:hypothetical protein